MSESDIQTRQLAEQLKHTLATLREATQELPVALESESTIIKLSSDAKRAVQDQAFPEVAALETSVYQEMVKKYEWRQAVIKKIWDSTEKAESLLQLLALESLAVAELLKRFQPTPTNPRDPNQLTFTIRLIERALSLTGRDNLRHRGGNAETKGIMRRVKQVWREAARQSDRPTSAEICRQLDAKKISLPESTVWGRKSRTWREALNKYRGAVNTWLWRAKSSAE